MRGRNLTHGLTANAHSFDGVIEAGGAARGARRRFTWPKAQRQTGPGIRHSGVAADIIGMPDALGMDRAVVGGHSFGGLLSIYLASRCPDRIEKIVIIDAAARLHPNVAAMVMPSMSRLGKQ